MDWPLAFTAWCFGFTANAAFVAWLLGESPARQLLIMGIAFAGFALVVYTRLA